MHNDHLFRTLIVQNRAIRDGHFVFTRDWHSRFQIDFSLVLQNTHATKRLVSLLYSGFKECEVTKVITPNQTEGFVLAFGVAAKHNASVYRANRFQGTIQLPDHLEFKRSDRVLLVDDGINTGNSMRQLVAAVQDAGAACCGITVCTNRYYGSDADFQVPVQAIFDARHLYPLKSATTGCDECARLEEVNQRLKSETSEDEMTRLLQVRGRLQLKSGYAEWQQ